MTTLSKTDFDKFNTEWAIAAQAKTLTAADHFLYNLVHERAIHTGFTPTQSESKLINGLPLNECLYLASHALRNHIRNILSGKTFVLWPGTPVMARHLPLEYLEALDIPKIDQIAHHWGFGKKIVAAALEKRMTFEEIQTLIDENDTKYVAHDISRV